MNKKWVDFDQIKKTPGVMRRVLEFYGLADKLKERGSQLTGICPIHKGTNKTEFSVNTQKSIFQCFSCKAKGDAINLVEAMENLSRRDAALKIASLLNIVPDKVEQGIVKELVREGNNGNEETKQSDGIINPPLRFELKNIDPDHPYLKERVLPETISHFGLGLCKRGIMKDRIIIPLHNEKGDLVGYAGRWPGDPPEGEGKYKLPPNFQKSHVLFNLHRAKEFIQNGLILVEGYFSIFKLFQAGFPNAAALMGSQLSQYQEELILKAVGPKGKVILLFDSDEAGFICQEDALKRLSKQYFVKVAELKEGQEIDRMEEKEIKALLKGFVL